MFDLLYWVPLKLAIGYPPKKRVEPGLCFGVTVFGPIVQLNSIPSVPSRPHSVRPSSSGICDTPIHTFALLPSHMSHIRDIFPGDSFLGRFVFRLSIFECKSRFPVCFSLFFNACFSRIFDKRTVHRFCCRFIRQMLSFYKSVFSKSDFPGACRGPARVFFWFSI